jgi:hypothetical protein
MKIDEVNDYIKETIAYIDSNIKMNYEQYKKDDKHDFLNSANSMALGQMVLNKSVFENIKDCLDPKHEIYNCFSAITPILEKLYPNKKDWLPVFGYLLSKAKKVENDYAILTHYLEVIKDKPFNHNVNSINDSISKCFNDTEDKESLKETIFLDNIVDENGNFLPYMLSNYDRFMLQAIGMDFSQVALVSKECRSLYKKEQSKKSEEPIKGTARVDINKINSDIKLQKEKLEYIKRFLSLDSYEIIASNPITIGEEASIIAFLEDLDFSKEKVELVKTRISRYNEFVKNSLFLAQIEQLKQELFTNEMFGLYEDAKATVVDGNVVYKNIKEQLADRLAFIDSLLCNCLNGVETKDDTCEYLVMAFEDLHQTLKLCGPRLVRA